MGDITKKTSNAWLVQMDTQKDRLMPLMREVYGADQAATWWLRWRLFFMACAELFGYRQGQEWWVGHYLFIQGETG
jgi:cyclopropane-fatty-acyl-phospholipid synthase